MLSDKLHGFFCLVSLCNIGMRKNDTGCVSYLIVVELAKVLHIHFALVNIGNCGEAVELRLLSLYRLNSLDNVGELAYSAGLNNNTVGMELIEHLCERLGEITYKRAADASGVHLGDLNACVLKETAIDTDLAKLVLYKYKLFACVCFLNKLFDKCSLTCSKETGKNIYFRHFQKTLPLRANLQNILYICIIHF